MSEVGPIYGVELIDDLPLDGGVMWQAMPSRHDLDDVRKKSQRTVAGYEVLLTHWRRGQAEIERLRTDRKTLLDAASKTAELVMKQAQESIGQRAELDRLRELCGDAEHWLTVPPTTRSDHDNVAVLCQKLCEASRQHKDKP